MNTSSAKVDERLRPAERLKRRAEFQAVFNDGRRANGRYMTIVARPNQLPVARLGVVASKKLGDAVQRNRAKRLLRELFRRNKRASGAVGFDIVVIPRRELLEAAFTALEADYQAALRRDDRRSR